MHINRCISNGRPKLSFVRMPEATTFGADEDRALWQAVDALAVALSFYIDVRVLGRRLDVRVV